MNTGILNPDKDPMGAAILAHQQSGRGGKIRVLSSMFDEDSIDVPYLFRDVKSMPRMEQTAMRLSRGRVLDVGAGAGCHTLPLQETLDVTAIDISPLSVEAMELRGVKNCRCINLFDPVLEGAFDTILLLMNGSGIIGNLRNMPKFFARMKQLLAPDGQVLMDSSDLKYLYENEDGSYDIDPTGDYYGQVDFQMIYKKVKGDPFDWLYIDFDTLKMLSGLNGFQCEKVVQGAHYDYLAKLTLKQ